MAMPFSPCGDSGECTDKSVEMLQYVFGDAVAKLATGNSVDSVTASGNIIATMFSYFNTKSSSSRNNEISPQYCS